MDTYEKLRLLSEASKYDLACACSTNGADHRQRTDNGTWLYPVSLPGGGHSVIPGASEGLLEEALGLADAVSINIETPGKSHFEKLTCKKDYMRDIIKPMQRISELTSKNERFSKVRTTTQFIVGASDERDAEIVKYTAGLYGRLGLDGVYFSSYQSGLGDKNIPGEQTEGIGRDDKFVREHRLYQVDFLLRKYDFKESDIIFDNCGNLSLETDPKQMWARFHPEFFPVNINRADKRSLLRIPGIGPQTARRIINIRKDGKIKNVKELPFRGKRFENAIHYLTF